MKNKILIIDDKANTLKVVGAILQDEGYEVVKAHGGSSSLNILEKNSGFDAVLADLKMPGIDGLELFRRVNAMNLDIPFIIMTAHGTIESAVAAMKEGVTNYLIKPLNYDELSLVLERAIREKAISRELADLRQEVRDTSCFQHMIGNSRLMQEIFKLVKTVSPTDAPVLINGETGTGKELMAKAIHSLSKRKDRPMICINSAALAENLLEAELFGHVKGSFTGAVANRKGRLEMADQGTLFLDEIGQMSLRLQAKLLRFLQEGTFEPVGSVETRKVDVRLITATNRHLQEEIKAGRFLSDLFYRIEVIAINLAPLRERDDDIPLLLDHFVKKFSKKYEKTITKIHSKALDLLLKHDWPGNIRELENCIARAVIVCPGNEIKKTDLPTRIVNRALKSVNGEKSGYILDIPENGVYIKEIERELIEKTLKKCAGNKSLTAGYLGISRKALYEKIHRYCIPS